MIQKYLIFILIVISVFSVKAQNFKDELTYKVTYKLTYLLDSTDVENRKSEYMILYIGDELSLFSSRAKTLANPITIRGNSGHTSRSALTQFQYEIIKNNKTQKLYYTLKIPKMGNLDWFYYESTNDLFEWKIETDSKEIKGYKVQKATTSFGGRNYIAWFSPEIPVSAGPYKFNGLPGLIIEISDTKNHWQFEFVGLKKLTSSEQFKINLNQYVNTEKEELMNIWFNYRSDPLGYSNNPNVKITPEVHKKYKEAFKIMLEKENNPIELE